jgi:hypothetical protein
MLLKVAVPALEPGKFFMATFDRTSALEIQSTSVVV